MSVLRQASCVAIEGRAVLIEGPPGAGKTTLALALIDRGGMLVGDDGVSLAMRDRALWASPPPNIAGLVEVRNVGLVTIRAEAAPVSLVLWLTEDAPRLPAPPPDRERILSCAIPRLEFFPGGPIPALRAEWALATHGLPAGSSSAQDRAP